MITAEEFIEQRFSTIPCELDDIQTLMIGFAKMHVEAALKAAAENAEMKLVCDTPETEYIDEDSILNSYPLSDIN